MTPAAHRTVRATRTAASTAVSRALAERGGLAVTGLFYLVIVAVLSGLWRVATRGQGPIVGYSGTALTWYIAMAEVGTVSVGGRLMEETGDAIGSGDIAVELLRPVAPLACRLGREYGRALPRVVLLTALGAALSLITVGAPQRWATMPLVALSVLLAVACNVTAQHLFAASAFWLRDAGTAWFLYQKLILVAGGILIPLQVLPPWLRIVADVLPFRAMGYAQGRLAAGFLDPWLLVHQLAWLTGLVGLSAVAFTIGERRLQVLGG